MNLFYKFQQREIRKKMLNFFLKVIMEPHYDLFMKLDTKVILVQSFSGDSA